MVSTEMQLFKHISLVIKMRSLLPTSSSISRRTMSRQSTNLNTGYSVLCCFFCIAFLLAPENHHEDRHSCDGHQSGCAKLLVFPSPAMWPPGLRRIYAYTKEEVTQDCGGNELHEEYHRSPLTAVMMVVVLWDDHGHNYLGS